MKPNVAFSIPPPVPVVTATPTPPSLTQLPLQNNIRDLLELHEDGLAVLWPSGFNYESAKAYVRDYDMAIGVGNLYKYIHPAVTTDTTYYKRAPEPISESPNTPEVNTAVEPGAYNYVSRIKLKITPRIRKIVNIREYEKHKIQFSHWYFRLQFSGDPTGGDPTTAARGPKYAQHYSPSHHFLRRPGVGSARG